MYWHRTGPRPGWTAEELIARVEELRDNRASAEDEPPDEPDRPPGWPYHHLLQGLGPAGRAIGYADPPLVAHLTVAEPATLRAIACWAAEQALTMVELRDVPLLEDALAAARRGEDAAPDLAERIRAELRPTGTQFQAAQQVLLAAQPPTMEATCSILQTAGLLTGGSFGWIVAAVRRVFPALVPRD